MKRTMIRLVLALSISLSLLISFIISRKLTIANPSQIQAPLSPHNNSQQALAPPQNSATENLLVNGDMDQLPFYWRPTNHYVAGQWFEWWADYTNIPEYIDGGIDYHNACYPPPPDGWCKENHSQGYIRWGGAYAAGIYQIVNGITPCSLYEFQAYTRNDGTNYHPKVGIEPTGWYNTKEGGCQPQNCPPDGKSYCPDPYLDLNSEFPSTMTWSPALNNRALTWEPVSVMVEALSTTLSVWTYAAPEESGPLSTYWDAATLEQLPFPDNRLPEPEDWAASGFITNIQTTVGDNLLIEWDTSEPGSTQVWYNIAYPVEPISNTTPTNSVYLPVIYRARNYAYATVLDLSPTLHHQAVITNIEAGMKIEFVALSRRVLGTSCATEISDVQVVEIPSY